MGIRVQIIGEHPWTGFYGELLSVETPLAKLGIGQMGRVRLERGQDCPDDHECFAESKNLRQAIPIRRCFRKGKR